MLRTIGFDARMTKHNYKCVDNIVVVCMSIKHTSKDKEQFFLDSLEEEIKTSNIQNTFKYPIQWKKVDFDFEDSDIYFEVEFDKVVFIAKLTSVNVSRKYKDGIDTVEYNINFTKEVEGENKDSIVATNYLKYKEENLEGKKVFVDFPVKLVRAEAPARPVANPNDDESEVDSVKF